MVAEDLGLKELEKDLENIVDEEERCRVAVEQALVAERLAQQQRLEQERLAGGDALRAEAEENARLARGVAERAEEACRAEAMRLHQLESQRSAEYAEVARRDEQLRAHQLEAFRAAEKEAADLRDAELSRAMQLATDSAKVLEAERAQRAQQDHQRSITFASEMQELEAKEAQCHCPTYRDDRRRACFGHPSGSGCTWTARS